MKKMSLLRLPLMLLMLFFFAAASAQEIRRCGTMHMDSLRHANDPTLQTDEEFEAWMAEKIAEGELNKVIGGVYQIPVVFHVIHRGTHAVGTGTNVSFAAIQSQIDVLNEDFRRIPGTAGHNTHPDGADTEIEFCLAQRRPDGSAFPAGEPGVNRVNSNAAGWGNGPFTDVFVDGTIKPYTNAQGWDPAKYMNIWLVDLGGGLLGYAQFPTSPIGGMFDCSSGGPMATDGVVFLYSSIGKSSVTGFPAPYNEGRTATHEIGHWLGLRHIWGDANNCTVDDYCNDTPMCSGPNSGCPTGTNSCTAAPDAGPDMIENYMDYTYDACMNIFTNDQKQRMRTVLENSPIRASLINSDACTPPNPSDAAVTDVFTPKGDHCPGAITPSVQLRNRGSNNLTSATISYTIDNGTPTTFAWTGNLAAGASATVALPAFTATLGTHEFRAYSTLPNGVADPYTVDDASSITFVVSNGIMPDYSENFELPVFPPDIRWSVTNGGNDCFEWVGAAATSSANVLINSTAVATFYNNTTTQNEDLVSPVFILPCNVTTATLTFDVAHRRRTTSGNDRLRVEISQDCGNTWVTAGYDKAGTTLATVTGTQNSYFTPSAGTQWRSETIDILPFVGATSENVRFRFRATGTGGANGNNIYIDNMVFDVTTPGEVNVVQSGTDILDGGAYTFANTAVGATSNAVFTVQNTGTTNLTLTPPLTITGTGFAVVSTFGSTTLAPGATTTFTLSFTPAAGGLSTGTVSFGTNDCDEGTYNFVLNGTGTTIPPVADFSTSPTTVCVGQNVDFTNLSTGAASYSWSFGASATPTTSTAVNPTVVYNTPGTYPVTLTATNGFGSDVETKTGYITVRNTVALPINEGFTTATFPPTDWSISNGGHATTWQRSTSVGVTPTPGNSMFFNNYNFDDPNNDEMQLATVNLNGYVSSQLTFSVAYAPYNGTYYDGLEVLVSTDCGETFTSVYSKSNTTLATAPATTASFVPTAAQWRTETVSLTPYVGNSGVIVKFRNLAGNGQNLYVDNINLTGVLGTPVASFTGSPTTVCAGQSVTYTNTSTGSPTSYSWNFPGGTPSTSTATNPTVTYNTAGTYTVELTATNGSGSNTSTQTNYITVNPIPATPTITPMSATTFCAGGGVVLMSSSATGNVWSTGATTQSITVTTSGTYTVAVTSGGCTSATSAGVTVTVNPIPAAPTISAGGPTTFCSGGSVVLTSSSATGNLWSNGATTQSITVTTSGTYTVTRTLSGCTSPASAGVTVTVNPTPAAPTISAGGPTTFCSGGSVVLTSSSASGNNWSTGATTQSITVSSSGTYTVTTTTGGCTSPASAGTTVTVNPTPTAPTISAGGPTMFCSGGSVVLTSSSASGNNWSTGATTQSITVSSSGTYTVTTTSGGCTSPVSAGTTVTVNPTPAAPTISASGPTTFCSGGSVVLTSSSASGNNWSTGATTQSITVSSSGTYTVTTTSGGCTSPASAGTTVTVNPTPATPTISAGGPTTFCSGGSVVLTSSSASGNNWSTGATTQSITVSSSGTYTVSTTSGGCTSPASAGTTVTVNPTPAAPTISAGGPTTFCSGGNVVLTSSSASGNNWSTGATTQSITVSSSGTYTVSTTSGGCTSPVSAGTTVTVNPTPAAPTISAGGPTTFCAGEDVVLTSSSASGNNWSNGATTQSITVSASGTYTVSVTSGSCTSASSIGTIVTVNPLPVIALGTVVNPTACATITGSIQVTGSGMGDLSWSGSATGTLSGVTLPATIPTLGAGMYSITFNDGCTSNTLSQSLTDPGAPAAPTISADGPTTFCAGEDVVLTSSSTTGNNWSNGETTQSITVTSGGTYTVTATAAGCTSAASAGTTITVNPIPATPAITADGPTTFCSGGSVVLTSSSASGNNWSDGATTQSTTASASGTYTVTVTELGCTSAPSAGTVITVNPNPTVTFDALDDMCIYDSPLPLTQGSPSGGDYTGDGVVFGHFNPAESGPGTFVITYTYTDGNGCSGTATSSVVVDECLGLADQELTMVKVFPNPSTGNLVVDAGNDKLISIAAYDNLGKLVLNQQAGNAATSVIDLSFVADGVYTLRIVTATGSQNLPVVIKK